MTALLKSSEKDTFYPGPVNTDANCLIGFYSVSI